MLAVDSAKAGKAQRQAAASVLQCNVDLAVLYSARIMDQVNASDLVDANQYGEDQDLKFLYRKCHPSGQYPSGSILQLCIRANCVVYILKY